MADPFVLSLLFGSGALGGYAWRQERAAQEEAPGAIVLQEIFRWNDGWKATDLVSREALLEVGQLLDMDVSSWWPDVASGMYRAVVLSREGGTIYDRVLALLSGRNKPALDRAYHAGWNKVTGRSSALRLGELLESMRREATESDATLVGQLPGGETVWRLGPRTIRVHSLDMGHDLDDLILDRPWLDPYMVTDRTGEPMASLAVRHNVDGSVDIEAASGALGAPIPASLLLQVEPLLERREVSAPGPGGGKAAVLTLPAPYRIPSDHRPDELLLVPGTGRAAAPNLETLLDTARSLEDDDRIYSYLKRSVTDPRTAARLSTSPEAIGMVRQIRARHETER